jgi:tetratricopeptide (TPR) repeat protein
MRGPLARVLGAIAVLMLFHNVLLVRPAADVVGPASAQLDRTLVSSRDAFAAGRFDAALAPTLALVEALPGQPMYLERLAKIYQALERPADEARTWEAFTQASAVPIEACPMLPEAHRRAGNEAAALASYERCLSFDPKNVDALLQLGQAYLRANRAADARRVLEQGARYAPQYADYQLVLGVLDFADDRVADARARFERFLALAPERRSEVAVWLERTRSR